MHRIIMPRAKLLATLGALLLSVGMGAGACKEEASSGRSRKSAVKEDVDKEGRRTRLKKERRNRKRDRQDRRMDRAAGPATGEAAPGAGAPTCEALRKRNESCRPEIAAAVEANISERIPRRVRDRVIGGRKDRYASERWARRCQRRWDSGKARHVEEREAMEKCLTMPDCAQYAKCFTESLGRRGRRNRARATDAE